ncbi:MAG: 4-(cytidine 5'-diphospho)-2-C-methyl-D-erythritol kinase [Alphaproteobacteria bacterium]|nr:4-(cytidine 5'-diphospho)-2-C-methyl-D-erythritol kinase [Alphaproteobacteria bacterium]MBF0249865.1 4-(cytidine 5'-diphospho)-2-C-methyl-D-erythritol kinase [Alphaproteobacteria bacterium]
MTITIAETAPAKVNLYLHVTGRRDDGYHELDSLVVFAGACDTVAAAAAPEGAGLVLDITGPFAHKLLNDGDNLVLAAGRALAAHAGVGADARLTLDKHLPVAAGIGGGSADAAAALQVLARLWRLDLHDDDIHHAAGQLARDRDGAHALAELFKGWRSDVRAHAFGDLPLSLGADVPVCLEGRPVFMSGIGERLVSAPALPKMWMVLVNPGIAVSTPAVFKARQGGFTPPAPFTETPRDARHFAELLGARRNDLMAPAMALAPVIGEVAAALEKLDGALLARMSGSGATCFALFAERAEAEAGARRITDAHPDWWCAAAPMLSPPEGGR